MLQQDTPDDYVIATGTSITVRDFCQLAFSQASLDADEFVSLGQDLLRPAEVNLLRGDASKARRAFGWQPSTSLQDMVAEMVDADIYRHRTRLAA